MNPEHTDDFIRFTQFNSELFNLLDLLNLLVLLNLLLLLNSFKVFIAPQIDSITPQIDAN